MLKARFYQDPDKGSVHMVIKGHAGAAPKGRDLVCAGATTLAYTVAQCVKFMQQQGKLKVKPKISLHNGKSVIIATPVDDQAYAECLHAFFVAQCGMDVLAANYPDNVKISHL